MSQNKPSLAAFISSYNVYRKCIIPIARQIAPEAELTVILCGKKEKIVWSVSKCRLIVGHLNGILSLLRNKYSVIIFVLSDKKIIKTSINFLLFLFLSLFKVKVIWVPDLGGLIYSPGGLINAWRNDLINTLKSCWNKLFSVRSAYLYLLLQSMFVRRQSISTANENLVILGVLGIGDLTATTPYIRAVNINFPGHKVNCLSWGKFKDISRCIPGVDYWYFTPKEDSGCVDARVLRQLYQKNIKNIFVLGESPFIGYLKLLFNKAKIYNFRIVREAKTYGSLGLRWLSLNYLMQNGLKTDGLGTALSVPPEVLQDTEKLLSKQGIGPDTAFAVIVPGRDDVRTWLAQGYLQVARFIAQHYKYKIVISGASDTVELLKSRAIASQLEGNCLNLTGSLSQSQLVAVIKKSKLVVCNDSGPAHIAFAVGTPAAVVYGATDPVVSGYNHPAYKVIRNTACQCSPCTGRCILPERKCMQDLTPEMVIGEIKQLGLGNI
ncbi:MAG: glycosyltransferase family 9 protein [Candidatus Omnitrophica bacterium]|nr:glycosyltransferase family 9 protein [Candidatus Omnitrophota bacterium]